MPCRLTGCALPKARIKVQGHLSMPDDIKIARSGHPPLQDLISVLGLVGGGKPGAVVSLLVGEV